MQRTYMGITNGILHGSFFKITYKKLVTLVETLIKTRLHSTCIKKLIFAGWTIITNFIKKPTNTHIFSQY